MATSTAPQRTTLPPTWRDNGKWRITAMIWRLRSEDYLIEARAFESYHLGQQTLSDNWLGEWRSWCKDRGRHPEGLFCNECGAEEPELAIAAAAIAPGCGPVLLFCDDGCLDRFKERIAPPSRVGLFG